MAQELNPVGLKTSNMLPPQNKQQLQILERLYLLDSNCCVDVRTMTVKFAYLIQIQMDIASACNTSFSGEGD